MYPSAFSLRRMKKTAKLYIQKPGYLKILVYILDDICKNKARQVLCLSGFVEQ